MHELAASGTVAFIGLGAMGTPMATRLVEAGAHVRAYDVSEKARSALRQVGAESCATAAEAASEAQLVILMLPNSDIVENVVEQIHPVLQDGALVIDMSSSEPLRTRALAERLAPKVSLVDAPVSGGVVGARNGKLTIMVGGEPDQIDRIRDLMSVLGTLKVAGGVGAGHAVKALNNLLSATHLWVTSEAMTAGQQFGVDPEAMLEIFNGSSGRSGSTENKWPNFILPGTYNSGFALALMLKDMRIATELARDVGLPSRLGETAVERWADAAAGLPANADHTEVARWISESP